ncbi:metal-binding protein [Pleurocapsales cyanobacterium LEGE 06147]|nr:metal-binding protein [Pleurocapsales cyanobacterium LEGE 06147]
MPSGRTHDRLTLWSLPPIAGGTFWLTRNGELTLILAAAFLFSGLMFGPDLDIYSIQFKRWGWLRWIWLPYQKALRHRSLLSHGLIIGTVLRVLYLFTILAVIAFIVVAIAQLIWGFAWNWQQFAWQTFTAIERDYRAEALSLWLGLELGSLSHSLSDWIISTYQARRKKGLKKRRLPVKRRTSSRR